MSATTPVNRAAATDMGREMHALVAELYPLCRSITGAGTRETLEVISRRLPLLITELMSTVALVKFVPDTVWDVLATPLPLWL